MPKIIVIDDEHPMRVTIEHLLKLNGYEVRSATDGDTGARLAEEWEPDLVITDILMPGEDGYSVIERVRTSLPEAKIIAMSGLIGPSSRQQVLELGANACVTKPIEGASLLRLVRGVLGQETAA